jgi:hypothetical protein
LHRRGQALPMRLKLEHETVKEKLDAKWAAKLLKLKSDTASEMAALKARHAHTPCRRLSWPRLLRASILCGASRGAVVISCLTQDA